MDYIGVNESPSRGVTSLEGLYTDFDGWVARYNAHYKRSTYFSKEISTKEVKSYTRRHSVDNFENDPLFGDLLLRQRHSRHLKSACWNFQKENDGFVHCDHIFYRLTDRNGGKRIVYQYIRSKL